MLSRAVECCPTSVEVRFRSRLVSSLRRTVNNLHPSLSKSSRPLAVAGAGPPRDIRERPACSEQSPREHPHRSPYLDHGRQAGGSQRQHSDGGEDHRQSHHLPARQRCGDKQGAVDTGERRVFTFL